MTPGASGLRATLHTYVALTKPSITRMCLLMAAGAMFLAPRAADHSFAISLSSALVALLGITCSVASANALNMWLERATDPLMRRTKARPIADGRIPPRHALVFGLLLAAASLLVLAVATNLTTTALAAAAIFSYVWVYTPLKYVHPLALAIGALPGAAPPLLGWTAVTGHLDLPGLVLFAVLFVWQMPHFIAISIFRRPDYAAAKIRTVTAVRGLRVAKWQAAAWAALLIPTSLLLIPTGVSSWLYGAVALVAGLAFLALTLRGFRRGIPANGWAYRLFMASNIYLPVLITGLTLDVLL